MNYIRLIVRNYLKPLAHSILSLSHFVALAIQPTQLRMLATAHPVSEVDPYLANPSSPQVPIRPNDSASLISGSGVTEKYPITCLMYIRAHLAKSYALFDDNDNKDQTYLTRLSLMLHHCSIPIQTLSS